MYRFTNRFIGRIVPYLQVRVIQRLLAANPLGRVKTQHLGEEVDCEGVGMGVQGCKRYSWFDGQRPDVVLCLDKGYRLACTSFERD